MNIRKFVSIFFVVAFTAAFIATPASIRADENAAKSILKSMSDYIGSQKTIQLTFDSGIEIITPQLEKIQFTNSGAASLVRPNKLYAHRQGGYADVEMFFDGKAVTIYGKHVNGYAQLDATGNVDDLLHALREGHGISLPGSDLLLSNSYETLIDGVMEAKYMGVGVINGEECEHLAFRNFDTDWQLWVRTGKEAVPCKMIVTSKTINSAPQYTLEIRSWKTGASVQDESFVFTPPSGAKKLGADELIEFDELPPGLPEGEK